MHLFFQILSFQLLIFCIDNMSPMLTSKLISRKALNLSLTRIDCTITSFYIDSANSVATFFPTFTWKIHTWSKSILMMLEKHVWSQRTRSGVFFISVGHIRHIYFRLLWPKFKGSKTKLGNAFITDLFKFFWGFTFGFVFVFFGEGWGDGWNSLNLGRC